MTDIHPEPQGKCTKAPATRFFSSRSRPFEYGILTILLLTLVSMFDAEIQSALGVPPKPIEISPGWLGSGDPLRRRLSAMTPR
jgi:hypothetical protein